MAERAQLAHQGRAGEAAVSGDEDPRLFCHVVAAGTVTHDDDGSCSRGPAPRRRAWPAGSRPRPRSEEHTSELQSRRDLVCRLLLEKKKKNPYQEFCLKKKKVELTRSITYRPK